MAAINKAHARRKLRASLLVCTTMLVAPQVALGQTSAPASRPLDPVVVNEPERATRTRRVANPTQRRPSGRVARQQRSVTPRPAEAAPVPRGEVANGPVDGLVAKQTGSSTKTATPILESPQSVSVVGREEMEQRGATTVTEALRYTPGMVTTARPATRYDYASIRGFGAPSFLDYVDGMRVLRGGFNAPIMDPWNIDRIEVLKGPSSVMYGSVMPGGLVNQVTKKPQDIAGGEVALRTGYPGRIEGAFDLTGPVDKDRTLLYRILGLGRYQEGTVDLTKTERLMIVPSFTWRATPVTELTVQAGYIHDPSSFYAVFLPSVGTLLPHPRGFQIPYKFNIEDPAYAGFTRDQTWAQYELKHQFAPNFEVRHKLRYMDIDSQQAGMPPVAYVLSGGLPTSVLTRAVSKTEDLSSALTTDTQAELKLATGPVQHTLLTGVDYQWLDWRRQIVSGVPVSSINYLAPVYGITADPAYTERVKELREQVGIYAQDQMKFGNFVVTVGGRQDWFVSNLNTTVIATNKTTPTIADQSAFTWRAGGAYVFESGWAPYVSYATSFEPVSGTGPGYDAQGGAGVGGVPFKPTTGEQIEGGVRYQPTFFNGLFTIAYFDIVQQNVLVNSGIANPSCSNPTNCQVQIGEVRSSGFEFEAKFEPIKGLNFIASYAYVDARTTKSGTAPGVNPVGATPTQVPTHQAAFWGNYQFGPGSVLAGFGLGGGVRYFGESFADPENLYVVPSYTLVDAALSYDFGVRDPSLKGLKLTINAFNLFDKEYVASCSAVFPRGLCYYGDSRTVMASMNYKW